MGAQAQTYTFHCIGEYISGANCPECTGTTTSRLFNGLAIRKSGAYFKNIDCPYIVKVQGSNLVFQEILYPNPETVTINLLATGFSTITGFRDSTACPCAIQDTTSGDPSITNEGILGVSAGGSNDALVTSNTSGATGVTVSGSTTITVTETTSANGGTITLQADTSLIATVNDINAINCRWCSVKKAMPFYSNNPQTAFEALRTYWASRMGEIVVDTTVLLTANTTVAAAVRFVGGGNINVSSTFTVTFQSTVEAEPKLHIFTGAGTYAFNGKSVKELFPYWFGALGNDSADDYDEIQKCIDAAIVSEVSSVRLLSGIHRISKGLLIRASAGQVTMTMEGVFNYNGDPGTAIYCTDSTNFAIGIQGGRACQIKNMYIAGFNRSYNPTTAQVIANTPAQWRAQYGRDTRYSPFAGIVIDPFKNGVTADGGYPEFTAQYSLSQATSAQVNIENVVIRYFIVGIAVSPSGQNTNGSEIKIENAIIQSCRHGVITANTQARSVDLINCDIAFVATGIDATRYGNQAAPPPRIFGGQMTFLKDILYCPASYGGGQIIGLYTESVYRIGAWIGLSGEVLNFKDCEIRFVSNENSGTTSPASVLDATGAKVVFVGGSLTHDDNYAPVETNVRELHLKGVRLSRQIINNPEGQSVESRVFYEGCQIDGYNVEHRFSSVNPVILGKDFQRTYGNLQVPAQSVSFYEVNTTNLNEAVFTNTNDCEDHTVLLESSETVTIDTVAMTATFAPSRPERFRVGDILFSDQNTTTSTPTGASKSATFGIVTSVGATDVVCSRIPGGITSGTRNIYLWAERIFTQTYLANITSGSNKCVIVSKNTGNPTLTQVWKAGTRVYSKTNQSPTSGLYTGLYVVSVTADTLYLSGNVGSTVSNLEIFSADYRGVYHSEDNTYQTGASASRTVGYQTGDKIFFKSHAYRESAIVTAGGFTPTVKFIFKKLTGLSASKPTPTSDDAGLTYYSTDTDILEIWDGTAWNPASADNSTTNEAWTVDADDADTELITTQTVKFQGAGINVTDYIPGTDILTITGTEVDGSVTNEIQTLSASGSGTTYAIDLSLSGGSVGIIEGTNITIDRTGNNLTFNSTAAGTVTGSGVANQVTYWTGVSSIGGDADWTFDGSKIAHVGTASFSSAYDAYLQSGTLTSTGNSVASVHKRYTVTSTNNGSVTGNSQYGIYLNHTIPATTQSSNAFGMLSELSNSSTAATGQLTSMFFRTTENENTTTLANRYGVRGETIFSGSGDFHTGYGGRFEVLNSGSGRWSTGYGNYLAVTNAITSYGAEIIMTNNRGTANTQRGIRIQNNVSGSGVVVNNAYGIELRGDASSSGVITTYYGIYQNTIPAGATAYFLYGNQSAARSYLSGTLAVGVNSNASKLFVRGTGATSATMTATFENSSGNDVLNVRDDQRVGIITATPNRTLEVSGETRITDLVTDTPTKIVGADADGDLDTVGIGAENELHITGGSLGTNFHTTISPATLTTVTNNWNPTGLSTAWIIDVAGNGSFVMITGITAPTFNKRLILNNTGDNAILLPTEMTSSTAGNRFAFGRDVILFPGKTVELMYSTGLSRWRLVSKAGLYDDVEHLYTAHSFNAPVSLTPGDYDFWDIASEAAATAVAPTSGRVRAIAVNTGSSAGGLGYVASKEAFFQTDNSTGTVTWAYCKAVIVTPSSLSDGTNDYAIRVGFNASTGGGGTTDGMYFQYNHSLVSGNWGTATTNGGSTQLNNSGIAVTTSTKYVLEMIVRPSLLVEYFIDGVRVATNDTFVSTGDDMFCVAEIEKSVGTAQRDLTIHTLQTNTATVK